MISLFSATVIFALFFSVGMHHVVKYRERPGDFTPAFIAYGLVWLNLGVTAFLTCMTQVFNLTGHPLADQFAFRLSYSFAFLTIVPYFFFASYLLWGKYGLSWKLMVLGVALALVGVGLIFSTSVVAKDFNWGSTWDFVSKRVAVYYLIVGILPLAASLVAFLALLLPVSESRLVRYRLVMTVICLGLLALGWGMLINRSSAVVLISRLLTILSGIAAHLAYFPPPYMFRWLGVQDDSEGSEGSAGTSQVE